jgi:hypothetical protein
MEKRGPVGSAGDRADSSARKFDRSRTTARSGPGCFIDMVSAYPIRKPQDFAKVPLENE